MVVINCPGSHTFTSTRTRTSWGIIRRNNAAAAAARAVAAATADLTNQINASTCAGGCLKVPGGTNVPPPTPTCGRVWWTLWIAVRCQATATGTATVNCQVVG